MSTQVITSPALDALDTYYQYVKARINAFTTRVVYNSPGKQLNGVVKGMLNAQDWPPKNIVFVCPLPFLTTCLKVYFYHRITGKSFRLKGTSRPGNLFLFSRRRSKRDTATSTSSLITRALRATSSRTRCPRPAPRRHSRHHRRPLRRSRAPCGIQARRRTSQIRSPRT